MGSGKRTYLRVSREGLNFDICAAPFGTGYFFSWWLAKIPRILLDFAVLFGIAVLGLIFLGIFLQQGCGGMLVGTIMFFGMLFGAGAVVRYSDLGWEPTVLSMPITGFIYGLLQDWPLDRQLDFACAAAALNCTAVGARGGIHSLDDIADLIATGTRHPITSYAAT